MEAVNSNLLRVYIALQYGVNIITQSSPVLCFLFQSMLDLIYLEKEKRATEEFPNFSVCSIKKHI